MPLVSPSVRRLQQTLFAVLVLLCLPLSAAQATDLSIEELVSLPSLSGTPPKKPQWSPDGSQLAFLWNDHGMPFLDLWLTDAQASQPRRLTRLRAEGDAAQAFGAHLGADLSLAALSRGAAARHERGVSDFIWSADGRALYVSYRGRILSIDVNDGEVATLVESSGGKSRLALAPDGSHLAFLQGGDLWLYRFEGSYLMQATRVGVPTISRIPEGRFATPDSGFASLAWSPDSRYIAMEYIDQRDAGVMPIPSYLHDEPVLHGVRRVYPGQEGVVRKVALYHRRDGQVRHLDLPDPLHRAILDIAWAPAGDTRLLVQQDSYDGEHRWIYVADPANGAFNEVYSDHRPRRIYAIFTAVWSSEGRQIVFVSDHEEYYQLYSVPAVGGPIKRLTRGSYDIAGPGRSAALLEAHGGSLFVSSSEHDPAERQIYRLPQSGGDTTRLTRLPGTHEAMTLSPDGKRLAVLASNDSTPTELYVLDARGGDSQRVTRSQQPAFAKLPQAHVRYVSFPSRIDDFTLHARIVEPANLDPAKRYPVVVGSVYSATARNHWPAGRPINELQYWMAATGDYITVQVDLRGSAGYGVAFRESFQGDWGGGDLEDLHSTVDYLKTLPYVDADRIGIWGNSYGGMMVLFALFEKPGMFAAGVSGSPAIDVRYFTQNDMHLSRREHTHPETFAKSTLLNYGEKLEDPLMFIHGFHDDIVPFKTTAEMMEKLMLLGKDFDQVIPPQSAHWWAYPEHYAVHTFRKFMQFFERHVGGGAR